MTQFDLFSMVFLTLDHYWDEHKGEELGQFLSSMNPFLLEGEGSAVPNVFADFCKNCRDDVGRPDLRNTRSASKGSAWFRALCRNSCCANDSV